MGLPRAQTFAWKHLESMIDRWLEDCRASLSPKTAAVYKCRASAFVRRMGIQAPCQITRDCIQRHIHGLIADGASPSTCKGVCIAVRSLCAYLVLAGVIPSNPCHDIRRPTIPEPPPRYLDEAEAGQALDLAAECGIFLQVLWALKTGMRVEEMQQARWEDIRWEARQVLVPRSKSHKPRLIPLHPELLAASQAVRRPDGLIFPCPNGPLCLRSWHNRLKPLREAMPVFTDAIGERGVGRGWHLFRHTFATRLVARGVSIYKVSKWLGHSHVQTTERYAHHIAKYDDAIENA